MVLLLLILIDFYKLLQNIQILTQPNNTQMQEWETAYTSSAVTHCNAYYMHMADPFFYYLWFKMLYDA